MFVRTVKLRTQMTSMNSMVTLHALAIRSCQVVNFEKIIILTLIELFFKGPKRDFSLI